MYSLKLWGLVEVSNSNRIQGIMIDCNSTELSREIYLIFWSLTWKMKSMHEILLNFLYFHVLFIRLLGCYPNTTAYSIALRQNAITEWWETSTDLFWGRYMTESCFPYSSSSLFLKSSFRNVLRESQEHKQLAAHPRIGQIFFL